MYLCTFRKFFSSIFYDSRIVYTNISFTYPRFAVGRFVCKWTMFLWMPTDNQVDVRDVTHKANKNDFKPESPKN